MSSLVRFALVALFPGDEDVPGLADLSVDEKLVQLRRDATPLFWFGLWGAALLFQLTPILTVKRPWPAVFLTEEQLDDHANQLATHRIYVIRQIVMLLKLVGGLFWGQSPEIRALIALPAYAPDPGTRRTEALVTRTPLALRSPSPPLIQLGKREEERGRGEPSLSHALDVEAEQS